MDFWKTVGVLLRRWYVAVPVFVGSLLLAGGVFVAIPTQYESTGTVVVTEPKAGGTITTDPTQKIGTSNPLLSFEGSLAITIQLLIQNLNSPDTAQQLANAGATGTYTAGDGQLQGPFLVVVADAKSAAAAQHTVALTLQYARQELIDRQQRLGAPPSTYIAVDDVVAPTPAITKLGGKVRYAGAALALGLAASLCSAFMIESFFQHRRTDTKKSPNRSRNGQQNSHPRWPTAELPDGDTVGEIR